MNQVRRLHAVLFDLDGTLLDTAPDMVNALNVLCIEHSVAPVEFAIGRALVSNGALGLIDLAFTDLDETDRQHLRDRFLEIYANNLADKTILFDGMAKVLEAVEAAGTAWGIVTNKPGNLTHPLLDELNLSARCACIVSGDTLPERKPHPRPLLHAVSLMSLPAEPDTAEVMYVGDSARDIEAGNAAGMLTVAAAYGFIPPGDNPHQWDADHLIEHPLDLFDILEPLGALDGSKRGGR